MPCPAMETLPDKGLAHWHVRLRGTGLLARIPKQCRMELAALDNLRYQSACFRRAAASGHVPMLEGVVNPSGLLPRGALLVEEILGTTACEPGHLEPIVRALAAIHALPLPLPQDRAPLLNEPDPLAGLTALIEHVQNRVNDCLSMRCIERMLADFHEVQDLLATTAG